MLGQLHNKRNRLYRIHHTTYYNLPEKDQRPKQQTELQQTSVKHRKIFLTLDLAKILLEMTERAIMGKKQVI